MTKEERLELENKAKSLVGSQRHNFESKNDYKDYPCSYCGTTSTYYGGRCWQVMFNELKEKENKYKVQSESLLN